jgi:hypothetical protein
MAKQKKRKDTRATEAQMVEQVGALALVDAGELQQFVLGANAALQWCRWATEGFITPVEMLKVAKAMHKAGKRALR